MAEKIKISQAVIVEGKYDKIKLSNIIDAFIIETNGFAIFRDKQRLAFIKKLADERGIVILTDSDHAGFMIRNYLKKVLIIIKSSTPIFPMFSAKKNARTSRQRRAKSALKASARKFCLMPFTVQAYCMK